MKDRAAVHRKLRVAFNAVIDGNKARSAAAAVSAMPCMKNEKITSAKLCFHGTGSSSPALSLLVSRLRVKELYYFNLSPYLSRYYTNRISTSALRGIFFTSLHWGNQGVGSLGLLNSPLLKSPSFPHILPCHGPQGLQEYLKSTYNLVLSPVAKERFSSRTNVIEDESSFSQNGLVIEKIFVHGSGSTDTINSGGRGKKTLSYICRIEFQHCVDEEELIDTFKLNGKTSKEDAFFLHQLSRGEDAILQSTGELVHAKDFLKDPHRTSFAVVECPTESHFLQLAGNTSMKGLQSALPTLIAHFTPQNVFFSPAYQQWLQSFSGCKHLLLNNQSHIQYTRNEFKQIYSLWHINRDVFPQVYDEFIPEGRHTNTNMIKACDGLSLNIKMSGSEAWNDKETIQVSELNGIKSEIFEGLTKNKDAIQETYKLMHLTKNGECDGYFPRLLVLGSGGTHNHKYRAHPGFLLMVNKELSLLLDCGELALERIHKVFGSESEDVLASIKLIFISHHHLDHHCGFLTLLEGVRCARRSKYDLDKCGKIFCLLPKQMCFLYKPFVERLSEHIHLSPLQNTSNSLIHSMKIVIEKSIGVKSIAAFPVSHTVPTYGITLDTSCGKRVVYSSDTLPMSKELLRCGKNADLLIHDCLYVSDDFEMEANYRKHSTLGGALRTAQATNAKFTLLTHFSPFLPVQAIENIDCKNTAMAHDFLTIALKDLQELPKLEPVMKALFPKDDSGMKKRRDQVSKRIGIINDLVRMI